MPNFGILLFNLVHFFCTSLSLFLILNKSTTNCNVNRNEEDFITFLPCFNIIDNSLQKTLSDIIIAPAPSTQDLIISNCPIQILIFTATISYLSCICDYPLIAFRFWCAFAKTYIYRLQCVAF